MNNLWTRCSTWGPQRTNHQNHLSMPERALASPPRGRELSNRLRHCRQGSSSADTGGSTPVQFAACTARRWRTTRIPRSLTPRGMSAMDIPTRRIGTAGTTTARVTRRGRRGRTGNHLLGNRLESPHRHGRGMLQAIRTNGASPSGQTSGRQTRKP